MTRKYNLHITVFLIALHLLGCKGNNNNSSPSESSHQANIHATSGPLADTANYTTIQWLDSVQNFGKVTDGEKVLISFHFKNTGTKPLIITQVSAGCGCTVPEKPEAPIAPGQEGIIKAEFNSSGRVGQVSKNVNVICNTSIQNYTLLFEGEVIEKKQSK